MQGSDWSGPKKQRAVSKLDVQSFLDIPWPEHPPLAEP